MPSIIDIPLALRNQNQKNAFLSWLADQPIDHCHRKVLAHLWSADQNVPFYLKDWLFIEDMIPTGQNQ